MQVVVPMSGVGQRFRSAGYTEPKPLISVDGRPIIERVVGMFPDDLRFVFVCNRDHLRETSIEKTIGELGLHSKIVAIDPHKLGPVHAVLQACDDLDLDQPTTVTYCDYFATWDYSKFKVCMEQNGYEGAIGAYRGFHPHLLFPALYAGMRADENEELLEIREKHSFTQDLTKCWQSSGLYYFSNVRLIKKYFSELIERRMSVNDEYYVSSVYQLMVEDRLRVKVWEHPFFCQWGTPFDLELYQRWSDYFSSVNGAEI